MKAIIKIFLPFLALIFLFGCSRNHEENQYDSNAAEMTEIPARETEMKDKKSEVENAFASKASEASQGEIALGEMAIAKTKNKDLGAFAMMMIKDHRTVNGELMDLAKEKGIDLSSECLACEADYKNLHNLSTVEFEQQYAKKMVEDHEAAVKLFTEASQNEQDPDLRKWAAEKLPTLKHHLAMAKQLAQEEHVSVKEQSTTPNKSKRELRKERRKDRKTARS